ncbi:3-methyl-2-oxobutanoate hydroxymethyltransferase [Kribbella italica]|uniref:3-methyl-2-oxobutanoate hydroxymethyltransferase n=1 Tax=Kribbella italica TaxID=1540520 RepID=A0A7W9J1L3_9ACTN|nr:3-methyl-2-oxobutanoate hydroxymethyltransferase [Kribbella italica]
MVDNFMSAGTNGDADDELPAPYGTGPKNRTTEEHHRSDYGYADDAGDSWRDRSTLEGLDPSPSLPNAPRTYERGPVPQQPYVPKSPFLPAEDHGYPSQYAEPQRQYDDRRPSPYDNTRENVRPLPPEPSGRENGRGFPPEPGRDAGRDAGRELGREPGRLLPPDVGREPGRLLPPDGRDNGRPFPAEAGREPGRLLPPEGREPAREIAQESARYEDSPFAPSAYQERPPAPPQPGRQQSPFAPQQGEPPRRAPEPPANRQGPPPQQGTPPQRPAGPPPGNGSNGLTQHSNGTPGNGWSGSAPTPPPPPPSNGLTNRPSPNTPPPAPSNGSANGNGQPAPNPLGSSNGTSLGTSNGLGSGTSNGLGPGTGNGLGSSTGNGLGSGTGNGSGNGLSNGGTLSNSNGQSNGGHANAAGNGYPAQQSTGLQPAIQASIPTPPPPGAQQRPPANRPPSPQPPAAQQNAAVNGYPTDPSAEYESNHPETRPEQPRPEGRPEMRTEGRPVGARRRADVQQDAPSQVKAEAAISHRARRAQPGGDPSAPHDTSGPQGLPGSSGHPGLPGTGTSGQPGTPGLSSTSGLPGTSGQPGTPGQLSTHGQSGAHGQPGAPRPTQQTAAGDPTNSISSDPSRSGVLNAPGATGAPADGSKRPRKYRIHHLRDMKNRGEKWAMLTAYDQYTAEIFDDAGIPVLLVGDSAANNVYGYESTLRVTVDELIPLARAVATAAQRALVVADLPFGSYQASPEQAFHTAVRFMKEAGVAAVKLEGGRTVVPAVEKLTQAGIPVMAHIGFTPQSEHTIGGYRVQGRGDQAAGLIDDAAALAEAGAFSVVLEMVPGDVAAEITKRVPIPTIGIGAGRDTDAQVLVWQDMAGLRSGPMPRFVKQYADLRGILTTAATTYAAEVTNGTFPADEHTF